MNINFLKISKSNLILFLVVGLIITGFLFSDTLASYIKIDGSSSATISTGNLNKELVGHWPLSGEYFNSSSNTVKDISGYGNHGSNTGSTLTDGVKGESNGAFSFDGNDWIDFGNLGNPGSGTISLWFSKGNTSTQYLLDGRTTGNWWFLTHYNGHEVNFHNKVDYDGISTDNTWYHVVVTANSSETRMYINGDLVDTGAGLSIDFRSVRAATRYSNSSYLSGRLSDIRIYNRVISADEVKSLYESYKPKVSTGNTNKGLVLDMPLTLKYAKDDSSGSEIMADRTPYGNDGTNNGATIARGDNYAHFDGVNDYIELGDIGDIGNEFTYSTWFKTNSSKNYNTFLNVDGGNTGNPQIRTHGGNVQFRFFGSNTLQSSENYNDGKWHLATGGINESGDYFLYVDGVSQGTLTPNNSLNWNGNTRIGLYTNYTNYDGSLSRVKIYNRALSNTEISELYNKEKHLVGPNIVADGLVLYLDTNNPDSLEPGSGDGSTFYDITRNGNASFYTDSTMVDSTEKNRDEWVYFDGSGEHDGAPAGNHVVVDESLTKTTNSADGWTYFWAMKLTGDQPNGQRIFHGGSTIRHIEIKGEDTSSPSFRTEAAMNNGYSFGTGAVPGGSLIDEWNTFAIVWDNAASPRTVKWYKNGELFYTDSNFDDGTGGTDEYFSFNRIGRSGGTSSYQYTESLLGYLPLFMSYDRKLSEAEIQANHDAFKDRFGL